MRRFLLVKVGLLAAGWAAAPAAHAQVLNRVANYYTGEPGTASYEHFSFWSHEGSRYNLQYSHGRTYLDVDARYAGAARQGGQPAFRVQLANGRRLTLLPSGTQLLVAGDSSAAPKVFRWEYQGPVNGVGTACPVCTPDSAAAMQLVRRYFL